MSSHLGCQGILQTWKFKLRLEIYIISLGGIYCAFGSLISANTPRALGPGKPGEFFCFLSQCLSIMNVYDPFNAHIFYRRHNIPHPLENFLLSTLYLRYQFHTTLHKLIYLYIYISNIDITCSFSIYIYIIIYKYYLYDILSLYSLAQDVQISHYPVGDTDRCLVIF